MSTAGRVTAAIPPLQNGDHLTVKEFLRRYDAMSELKKAELINGVVYIMTSPVSMEHAEPDTMMLTWLGYYKAYTPGTQALANTTTILDPGENCPQPDGTLRILPEYGGRSRNSPQRYVEGGPELATEIALSRVSYDLHDKLLAYQRHGVQEYIVWRVQDEEIDWFHLRGDKYQPLVAHGGIYKSKVFPGLWLDAPAMLAGDLARVLKVLQRGIASDAHRRFVTRLAKRRR
jgi:Uma2 family endonuclease